MEDVATFKDSDLVISEVELIYHPKIKVSDRMRIQTADDAYRIFIKSWNADKIELQEHFRILMMDKKNGCIGVSTLSTGGISTCVVDLKIAFAMAFKAAASSFIIAHNHPSGNLTPSAADLSITEKFVEAGKLLDLPVLDHLIVTKEGYSSIRESVMKSSF